MSNISTFGTYTMARLGIYASHKALDITGNNISNINTKGYTRQTIDQISLNMGGADRYHSLFDTRVGSGAFVVGITQARDRYLDLRYRTEQANVGYMTARVDGLGQIASVLDEVGKGEDGEGVLEARFQELIQMMQTFNTQGAGKDEFDTLFRSAASQLVDTFHSYASQLEEIHGNMVSVLYDEVDQINSILTRIQELNVDIRKTHIYGGNALELQDERNLLLDELSQYMKIDVTTEREYLGENLYVEKLVVKTTDRPQRTLIDGVYATQLSVRQVPVLDENGEETGEYMDDPYYHIDLGPLTNPLGQTLKETVSTTYPVTDDDNKVLSFETKEAAEAKIKELLEEIAGNNPQLEDENATSGRLIHTEYKVVQKQKTGDDGNPATDGDGNPIYEYTIQENKVFKGEVKLGDQEGYGSLQARREILTKQGVFSTAEELAEDPEASIKRGIPFYQKALDVMANTFANLLNEANWAMNPDEGRPLFSNSGTGDNWGKGYKPDDPTTWDDPPITAANISISYSWATGSLRVEPTSAENRAQQSTMNDNLTRMLGILTSPQQFTPQGGNYLGLDENKNPLGGDGNINGDAVSKDVFFTGNFSDLLTEFMAGGLATDMNVSNTMLNNYTIMSDDLYIERDGVMGVDLNDEAMNMMMYEKSYAAACRLMTTYDSMLDKLINGTAI